MQLRVNCVMHSSCNKQTNGTDKQTKHVVQGPRKNYNYMKGFYASRQDGCIFSSAIWFLAYGYTYVLFKIANSQLKTPQKLIPPSEKLISPSFQTTKPWPSSLAGGKLFMAKYRLPHLYGCHTFKIATHLRLPHIQDCYTLKIDTHSRLPHIQDCHTFKIATHLILPHI